MSDSEFVSWQLTDFAIQDRQISLDGKLGLLKILRSEDGRLILVEDMNYGKIDHDKPTPIKFAHSDSIMGFVLDIGIRRERQLTYGNGFYSGASLILPQSRRPVSEKNFDARLCDQISTFIDTHYQSDNKQMQADAIRLQSLLDTYNNAWLMYRTSPSDSYLGLIRIIDALDPYGEEGGAGGFAAFAATISPKLNQSFCEKLKASGPFSKRLNTAIEVFDSVMEITQKQKRNYLEKMTKLDEAGKLVFACFYSAYQYRNNFVHQGFPFPDTVKESFGTEDNSVMAYLNPSLGIATIKTYRPEGLQQGDTIDIHDVLSKRVKNFKEQYFLLLPTWFFMKLIAREALLNSIVGDH